MKRILSVWLPQLPIDRLKHIHSTQIKTGHTSPYGDIWHEPFAVTASGRKGICLTAVNEAARKQGLYPAMALTDAKARLPGLKTHPADSQADQKLLHALADWCGRYSPWVNTDGPDGLWLDITGCGHLFGGEDALTRDLYRKLTDLGFAAQLALSDTPGSAWALTRYSRSPVPMIFIAPPNGTRQSLANLPIEGLRLPYESSLLLRRLGLKKIGALYGIPRASLARRFRPNTPSYNREADAVCHRLDQALGAIDEPIAPLAPPPRYRTRLNLPEPLLTIDSIDFCLKDLLAGLNRLLETDQQGARKLTLAAYRTDGSVKRLTIAASRPSRDPAHFHHLFREHLDGMDPGFGIDSLILNADRVEPLTAIQSTTQNITRGNDTLLKANKEDEAALGRLVDRLANRLGPDRVTRPHLRQSHIPERAQILRSALLPPNKQEQQGQQHRQTAARPERLFARPEPIDVMAEVPDGPPLKFTWRRVTRRVARAAGPERITPEWWLQNPDAAARAARPRDYYKVEDETGCAYWIYREGLYDALPCQTPAKGLPVWFVHGLFT